MFPLHSHSLDSFESYSGNGHLLDVLTSTSFPLTMQICSSVWISVFHWLHYHPMLNQAINMKRLSYIRILMNDTRLCKMYSNVASCQKKKYFRNLGRTSTAFQDAAETVVVCPSSQVFCVFLHHFHCAVLDQCVWGGRWWMFHALLSCSYIGIARSSQSLWMSLLVALIRAVTNKTSVSFPLFFPARLQTRWVSHQPPGPGHWGNPSGHQHWRVPVPRQVGPRRRRLRCTTRHFWILNVGVYHEGKTENDGGKENT